MNAAEFKQAVLIARATNIDLSMVSDDHHFGYGLSSFKPVYTTIAAVAKTIRWQAGRFDGTMDQEAINEVGSEGRYKFMIVPGEIEACKCGFIGEPEGRVDAQGCRNVCGQCNETLNAG